MKGLRKTYFPDYMTFTCLNKAYQNFIFKLSKVFDLLCPSKKFEANSKPWIDSETISAICRRDKLQQGQIIYDQQKWLFKKQYLGKRNLFFKKKIKKNANNFKELWKALKSLGMKSGKVNQSKITLRNDDAN